MTKPTSKTTKGQPRVGIREPWAIELSEPAVDFLRVPTQKGFNRLDAYCYLLNNCVMEPTEFKLPFGSTISLNVGELVVSITDLAEKWDWARETVRKFLDRLESLGMLVKRQLDRCSVISLRIVYVDPSKQELINAMELHPKLAEYIDKWLKGDIDDAEIASLFAHYFDFDMADSFHNKAQLEHFTKTVTIVLWIKRVAEHVSGDTIIYPVNLWQSMTRMVTEIYAQHVMDDWGRWVKIIRLILNNAKHIWPCLTHRSGKMLLIHLAYCISCNLDQVHRRETEETVTAYGKLTVNVINNGDNATAAAPGFPYSGL